MGHSIIMLVIAIIIIFALALLTIILRRRAASSNSAQAYDAEAQQLYIGNLSYRVHERDLRDFFSQYGQITHLKVVKDRETRRSKGFGFVTFATTEEANNALVAHGVEMSGRQIVVRLAKPR